MTVRGVLAIYFASLLRTYLLSPTIYMGLLFVAGLMGFVGAEAAKIPLPSWFSMMYLLFSFSIVGGMARSVLIGSGAFSYLTRHAGINPAKLALTLVLAGMTTQIVLSPLFTALLTLIYYVFDGTVPIINVGLIVPAVVLSSLFTAALGVTVGLILVSRVAAARLVNGVPLLVLCTYLVSLVTPAGAKPYNPVTAMMTLLAASVTVGGGAPTTLNPLTLTAVIIASSIILLILAITSMRRLREVNIYDILMSI